MRFKLDENLHPEAGAVLVEAGHDVTTVIGQGLRGAVDRELARICREEERVLVTLDKDFSDIRTYPPADYPGIIVCRLLSQSRRNAVAVFQRLVGWIGQRPLAGHLWIADESGIRIRGGDA